MEKLVEIRDRKAMTDSLKVAKHFEMMHKNVMREVNKCVETLVRVSVSRLTSEPRDLSRYFIKSSYTDKRGQTQPKYYITRDGFMMLIQRFRNQRAYILQLDFIDEFNELETENEVLSIENELLRRGSGCKRAYDLGVFTRKETYEVALKCKLSTKLVGIIDDELKGYIFAKNDSTRTLKKHQELTVTIQGEPFFTKDGIRWIAANLPKIRRRNRVILTLRNLLGEYGITNEPTQNRMIKNSKITESMEKILEPLEKEVQEKLLGLVVQQLHNRYNSPEDALKHFVEAVQLKRADLHEK